MQSLYIYDCDADTWAGPKTTYGRDIHGIVGHRCRNKLCRLLYGGSSESYRILPMPPSYTYDEKIDGRQATSLDRPSPVDLLHVHANPSVRRDRVHYDRGIPVIHDPCPTTSLPRARSLPHPAEKSTRCIHIGLYKSRLFLNPSRSVHSRRSS